MEIFCEKEGLSILNLCLEYCTGGTQHVDGEVGLWVQTPTDVTGTL